jgi:hypothetical protein
MGERTTIYLQGRPVGYLSPRGTGYEITDLDGQLLGIVHSQRRGVEILQQRAYVAGCRE